MENEFRQGEIITNVAQYIYDPVSGRATELYRPYVIVASQDCDMLWDFDAFQKGEAEELNGVLLYEAYAATSVNVGIKGKDWNRVLRNKDDRRHFLERVPAALDRISEGVPPLVIDFKRYFTIPHKELMRQCGLGHGARRRCRLEAPYREHLQSRLAFYLQRVMLPLDHQKDRDELSITSPA